MRIKQVLSIMLFKIKTNNQEKGKEERDLIEDTFLLFIKRDLNSHPINQITLGSHLVLMKLNNRRHKRKQIVLKEAKFKNLIKILYKYLFWVMKSPKTFLKIIPRFILLLLSSAQEKRFNLLREHNQSFIIYFNKLNKFIKV